AAGRGGGRGERQDRSSRRDDGSLVVAAGPAGPVGDGGEPPVQRGHARRGPGPGGGTQDRALPGHGAAGGGRTSGRRPRDQRVRRGEPAGGVLRAGPGGPAGGPFGVLAPAERGLGAGLVGAATAA